MSPFSIMTTEHVVEVVGMTCGGCSARLEKVLMEKSGIVSAEVDHEYGRAIIHTDDSVTAHDIMEIVQSTGFDIR